MKLLGTLANIQEAGIAKGKFILLSNFKHASYLSEGTLSAQRK